MFPTNLDEFHTRQSILHEQAEKYRLIRSLEKSESFFDKVIRAVGRMLVNSGQHLIATTRAAS